MIEIYEHYLPAKNPQAEEGRKNFITLLQKELADFSLSQKTHTMPCIAIKYGVEKPSSQFRVMGYNSKDFSPKDDITISVLRANLDRLTKDYADGIQGSKFQLVLSFVGDPFKENEKLDENRTKDESTLNVLPVEPRYKLDQMILEEKIREQLEDVITLVNLQDKIYDQWVFAGVDPKPRAIINFFGPSGTGKTMAAHALANQFGKKILPLNYADIESKFVGDAPKNLMAAFEIAKEHEAVLFFDEADSFLGRRITNVAQSADQAVNSLRSQMLMLLEEHSGTVIFATNLMENYDSAFKSRILKHIQFKLPVPALRMALIKKMLPARLPRNQDEFSEENLEKLVELSEGFSGREIKNAVLNGIIRSAKEKDQVEFDDIRLSFENAAFSRQDKGIVKKENDLKRSLRSKLRKAIGFGKKRNKRRITSLNKSYRMVNAL